MYDNITSHALLTDYTHYVVQPENGPDFHW